VRERERCRVCVCVCAVCAVYVCVSLSRVCRADRMRREVVDYMNW
jgi:hypothetical protein